MPILVADEASLKLRSTLTVYEFTLSKSQDDMVSA